MTESALLVMTVGTCVGCSRIVDVRVHGDEAVVLPHGVCLGTDRPPRGRL